MTNYKQRFYKDIFFDALQNAFESSLISHEDKFQQYIRNKQDISNFYVMLLSIHSEVFNKVYEDMTLVYLSSKIHSATGVDLDDLGEIVNCTRPSATKAGVEITFRLPKTYSEDKRESKGIYVTATNGAVYCTEEDLYFPAGTTECTVYAYAVNPGLQSSVIENQLTKISSTLSNIESVSCSNQKCSSGGSEAYNDDEYRELLSNWVKVHQKGNLWAYNNYFARTDGVDGYKLIPNWDGTGTIKVIIDPGDKFLLNTIYNGLISEVTQISEDIVLMAPVLKPIDIYITVNVDIDRVNPFDSSEKEIISSKIKQATSDYIENLKIGEDFIPHKLSVYLDKYVTELKNINFSYPSEPITISDEEQCSVGEIQISME